MSFRILDRGYLCDVAGSSYFVISKDISVYYILGFLNTKVCDALLDMINPTMNLNIKDVVALPIKIGENSEKIEDIVRQNIKIEKEDWDSYENSWNFKKSPLIGKKNIKTAYIEWVNENENRINQLIQNEIEINKYMICLYNLEKEISPNIEKSDIAMHAYDVKNSVTSFVSYFIGCVFGRYSLDEEGLIYAGGKWESSRYKTFLPDEDNCIPITDEEYFSDDIVGCFVEFVKTVYGEDTLEENLDFITNALGNKGDTSREVIRNYFLKDFYTDHLKVYQKRPIYWLFDSGKQNGFKALIYMHRYDADTVGRVRTDYLHRAQKYVETAMQSAQYTIDNASSASEKSKATKAVTKYTKQLAEMKIYDEAIAHIANKRIEIDLDDGVKVNYEKFQGVEVAQEGKKALKVDLLAKIK